jgi:phosphatidylglycerophosphate synthase
VAVKSVSPVRTLIAGAAAQVALFVGLALYTGLGPSGWLTGIAYLVIGCAALITGLRYYRAPGFSPADLVTMARAVLIGGVTVLIADIPEPVPVTTMVTIAAVALSLDAVDGQVARRTGTVSPFGARFDMETDALLILILAALVWQHGKAGSWILAAGLMRYLFVAASWALPRFGAALPPSRRRQAVCVVQIVSLLAALAPVVVLPWSAVLAGVGLAALVWSFAVDILWLARHARS